MHRAIKVTILSAILLASGCATDGAYSARVEISNAPPLRVAWVSQPAYAVEYHGVYVVDNAAYDADCDIFQYSGEWYAYTGGYWYSAREYDGPYVAIEVSSVPRRIFDVPDRHWRNNSRPDYSNRRYRNRDTDDWRSTSSVPRIRVAWMSRPTFAVTVHGVSVVASSAYDADYDIFRYSGNWYAYTGGSWYRASDHDGTYVLIQTSSVPKRIFDVPDRHWRHSPPNRDWRS